MSKDSRLVGNSITQEVTPEVVMMSCTSNPVGVIFSVWHGSRHKTQVTPEEIEKLYRTDEPFDSHSDQLELIIYLLLQYPEYEAECDESVSLLGTAKYIIEQVVKLAIKVNVQAHEFVSYEFQVNNASVAWREQLVRKRKLHIWTQTSRVADMTTFDSTMMPTVSMLGGAEAVSVYKSAVDNIRKAYKTLTQLGVPEEDIRLQPQTHIHRVYFGGTLRDILDLVRDRTSWIAQATLWTPIISGIIKSLRATLGDWVLDLLEPPAEVSLIDGRYVITDYKLESDDRARYEGHDPLPVSPIYLAYKGLSNNYKNKQFYDYLKSMYINIWSDEILKAIDWDKSNPLKAGKYDVGYEGDSNE